jgi:hypothetical protein
MMFSKDKVFPADPGNVFVFGSNTAGLHGGGAAKYALDNCGAVMGEGFGLQSGTGKNGTRSYALPTLERVYVDVPNKRTGKPTKQSTLRTLSFTELAFWVDKFHSFALNFNCSPNIYDYNHIFVTKVGCGLAGFEEQQVAQLFRQYHDWPLYVILPVGWDPAIIDEHIYYQ